MPIYEYQCQSCGEEIEVLQKLSDSPLVDCPACGQPALRKKVSAAAFRLKGGGWYETDFKTGNKKNLAAGSEKADSGAPSGGEKAGAGGDKAGGGGEKAGTGGDSAKTPKEKKGDTKKSA